MTNYEDIKSKNIDEMAKQLTVFEFNTIVNFAKFCGVKVDENEIREIFKDRVKDWKALLESEVSENDASGAC